MFNTGRKPITPLEQLVMDYIWGHPGCTAEMCREGLADQRRLKDSTVRTVLRNLEEKGYLTHGVEGRTFHFTAVDSKRSVVVQAALQLIDRFCGGSMEDFLVGLVDDQVLDAKQLQRLADRVAAHKEKRK